MTAEIINFEHIISLTREQAEIIDVICARTNKTRTEVLSEILDKSLSSPEWIARTAKKMAIENGLDDPDAVAQKAREIVEGYVPEQTRTS